MSNETSSSLNPLLTVDQPTKARIKEEYGKLALRFETNAGQADAQVKFISRGSGYNLYLTPTEAMLQLRAEAVLQLRAADRGLRNEDKNAKSATRDPRSVVRMKMVGGNPAPQVEGVDAVPSKSNYLIGNDQSKWRRNITCYDKVRYQNVYPGINLIYYGNQQQFEYDFVVAPGADPNAIKLRFEGVKRMSVDAQGDLVLHAAGGEVRQRKPVVYQEMDGRRQQIASRYVLTAGRQVSFKLAEYDRTRPLVIDPVIEYSTHLGREAFDGANSVAVDNSGNAYVMGSIQRGHGGGGEDIPATDFFITKFNLDGAALIYSTYLGGIGRDAGYGIAADKDGNAYVVGETSSNNFPTKNALYAYAGNQDIIVAKLTADGSALVFSTYLGGTQSDVGKSIAIDKEGSIYVIGSTTSTDFPTKNPLPPALAGTPGSNNLVVFKMKSDGSGLVYSTYLGGSGSDQGSGIAVDFHGNAYLTGTTESNDFPTANPLPNRDRNAGGRDAFVTKLNAGGTALIFSTYLGGTGTDEGSDIAVDPFGNAYVTGSTSSTNFPTVNPIQPALSGASDAFVAKFNQNGSALSYSTYLGGSGDDYGYGIAVDSLGRAHITGKTNSTDFPTVNAVAPLPGPRPELGPVNAFVTKLNTRGSRLLYFTYLGSKGADIGMKITVDLLGNAYVAGYTGSENFPITPGAFQTVYKDPTIPSMPAMSSREYEILQRVHKDPTIPPSFNSNVSKKSDDTASGQNQKIDIQHWADLNEEDGDDDDPKPGGEKIIIIPSQPGGGCIIIAQ